MKRLESQASHSVRLLATRGDSPAVRAELRAIETTLAGLREERATIEKASVLPAPRVHPAWVMTKLQRLDALLRRDPNAPILKHLVVRASRRKPASSTAAARPYEPATSAAAPRRRTSPPRRQDPGPSRCRPTSLCRRLGRFVPRLGMGLCGLGVFSGARMFRGSVRRSGSANRFRLPRPHPGICSPRCAERGRARTVTPRL
jgi:hypothetical protein